MKDVFADFVQRHQALVAAPIEIQPDYKEAWVDNGMLYIALYFTVKNMPSEGPLCLINFSQDSQNIFIGAESVLPLTRTPSTPPKGRHPFGDPTFDVSYSCMFSVGYDFGLKPEDVISASINFGEFSPRGPIVGNPITLTVSSLT